jgi:hypothetical protein
MAGHDRELEMIEERIAWVLSHRSMSPWLKTTLEAALTRDPIDLMNDLEILNLRVRQRCDALVRANVLGTMTESGGDQTGGT